MVIAFQNMSKSFQAKHGDFEKMIQIFYTREKNPNHSTVQGGIWQEFGEKKGIP